MAGIVITGAPTVGPGPWVPSTITGTSSTVFVNGSAVVLKDDPVATHIKPGKNPDPISGKDVPTSKVFIEGKQAAQIGDVCTEGEVICKSSPDVFAS